MYISTSFGSVGLIGCEDSYQNYSTHEKKINKIAKKHGVFVSFQSNDQGNDGYYIAVTNKKLDSEHIYSESIFNLDLSVDVDESFTDKFVNFITDFFGDEELKVFEIEGFSEPSKLVFT